MKPTDEQNEYIERVGRWWENIGSRSAGRILGWLMICDPPHRSAAELGDELRLSAGSVSTQTSTLERIGFLERITFPGDRVSYYQLRPNVWVDLMATEQQRLVEMTQLAMAADGVIPVERSTRVTDLGRVAQFLVTEWPALMERLAVHVATEEELK